MNKEALKEKQQNPQENTLNNYYALLSSVRKGHDLTVRDDQYDFLALLDGIRYCRRKGSRFRLVDSGVFERLQLELLLKAGADFYSSDEVRKDPKELEGLLRSYLRRKSLMAFFINGAIKAEEGSESLQFADIVSLGLRGAYLYTSNKERERDLSLLNQLAVSCCFGKSRLVYYHHGALDPALVEVGGHGAWIHISDKSIQSEEDHPVLMDIVKSTRSSGANIVIYLEKKPDYMLFQKVIKAGAHVLFDRIQVDYKSPLKELEQAAARKKLDSRAYYLYSTSML
jgi:hypothetical protein